MLQLSGIKYDNKPQTPIKGVIVSVLKRNIDERGKLTEILRSDDPHFLKFGQVYTTSVFPKVVKAWHYHKIQVDNITILIGRVRLVLFDNRKDSETFEEINELILDASNPTLVTIPPEIYHGFKGIGLCESILINVPTEHYNKNDPDEYRLDPKTGCMPYDWNKSIDG